MGSPRAIHAAALLLLLLLSPGALAHGGGALPGDTLERATRVAPPARLFEPELSLHYYRIELAEPTTLRLRLVAPPGQVPPEPPLVLVFGSGLPREGIVPPEVERPAGSGVLSFSAAGWDPGLDARLGVAWIALLDRDVRLGTGEFHVVVQASRATPLALLLDAPGAGWIEPLVAPLQRDDARAWAGAPAWATPVAGVLSAALVGAFAWRQRARVWTVHALAAHAGGVLVLASGFALAADAWRVREPAVLAWALAALAAGALVLASTLPARARTSVRQRALLLVAAVASFLVWAGALWGPLLAALGALLPDLRQR